MNILTIEGAKDLLPHVAYLFVLLFISWCAKIQIQFVSVRITNDRINQIEKFKNQVESLSMQKEQCKEKIESWLESAKLMGVFRKKNKKDNIAIASFFFFFGGLVTIIIQFIFR